MLDLNRNGASVPAKDFGTGFINWHMLDSATFLVLLPKRARVQSG
jgi:hypothetical protein